MMPVLRLLMAISCWFAERRRRRHACPGAEDIAAFVDATLTRAEEDRVVAHLVTCDDCRRLVARVCDTTRALDRGGDAR